MHPLEVKLFQGFWKHDMRHSTEMSPTSTQYNFKNIWNGIIIVMTRLVILSKAPFPILLYIILSTVPYYYILWSLERFTKYNNMPLLLQNPAFQFQTRASGPSISSFRHLYNVFIDLYTPQQIFQEDAYKVNVKRIGKYLAALSPSCMMLILYNTHDSAAAYSDDSYFSSFTPQLPHWNIQARLQVQL